MARCMITNLVVIIRMRKRPPTPEVHRLSTPTLRPSLFHRGELVCSSQQAVVHRVTDLRRKKGISTTLSNYTHIITSNATPPLNSNSRPSNLNVWCGAFNTDPKAEILLQSSGIEGATERAERASLPSQPLANQREFRHFDIKKFIQEEDKESQLAKSSFEDPKRWSKQRRSIVSRSSSAFNTPKESVLSSHLKPFGELDSTYKAKIYSPFSTQLKPHTKDEAPRTMCRTECSSTFRKSLRRTEVCFHSAKKR